MKTAWLLIFLAMVSYAIMENKKGHFGKVYFSKLLPDDRFLMRKLKLVGNKWTSYVEKGLTGDQLKFWFLFWGSVVAACALFYVYDRWLSGFLGPEITAHLNPIVTFGCVLLPAFVLRRLHVVIFIVLGLKLLDFLTKGD